MDALLREMHMAIFLCNFVNCFGKVTDPLKPRLKSEILGQEHVL